MAGKQREEIGEEVIFIDLPKKRKVTSEDRQREDLEIRDRQLKGSVRREEEEITSEDVDRLIDDAATQAAQFQGRGNQAAGDPSQKFHQDLRGEIRNLLPKPLVGAPIEKLAGVLHHVLNACDDDVLCRPLPKAGKKDLFPLPAKMWSEIAPDCSSFLQVVAQGLNSLNGVTSPEDHRGSSTSFRAMKRLAEIVKGSAVLQEPFPDLDFKEFFRSKKIDYSGEEIKVAKPLKWESISPSLPDEVGMLDLLDFCEGGVRHFVANFEEHLLPELDRPYCKPPRVMVSDDDWGPLARGLVSRGLCTVIRESEVFQVKGKGLFNGLFAVSKQEWQGPVEICRLIMNLRPINACSRSLMGDTGTLPMVTSLGSIVLTPEETLLTSSEDIRCFFYLFRTPEAWIKHMAFGRAVPKDLVPLHFGDERGFLASTVLPMGYLNSVGIAQHVHRLVVRRAMGSLANPIGGEKELRRDKPFSQSPHLFRIYLDNFDELVKVNRSFAAVIEGKVTDSVEKLRESYLERGLPRHPKKAVASQTCAEVQGAWVDGEKGVVSAKTSKVARYAALALELIVRGTATQRELQVVGGGLVYVAMFKRPLLSGLNCIWQQITSLENCPPNTRACLRREVIKELARFLCLLPLAFMDLRCPFDESVTASDASSSGGGICVSRGLTPYGMAASVSQVRGDIPEEHDFQQVLSIGLFDGIAALRVALDVIKAPIAGHVSVEKSPEARRVVEAYFPETIFVEDVELIDAEMVLGWSLQFSGVCLIIIGGGPPCQGVSGLNADRRGALRDSRSSLFKFVPKVVSLCKAAFPWAQVHFLAENVASMDSKDCSIMNEGYGCKPWLIDAGGISLCRRPRLYWTSWELVEASGAKLQTDMSHHLPLEGVVNLSAEVCEKAFLEPGWEKGDQLLPTFTTSRPSSKPHRRPAGLDSCSPHERQRWEQDLHRYPPYQYKDSNCLHNRKGEHRTPSVSEREVMLGFPVNFTRQCMKKSEHGKTHHLDCRLCLLGNSWSVPVIAYILNCLLNLLGLTPSLSMQNIVDEITPGKSCGLQSLLLRPPLNHSNLTLSCSKLLTQKIAGLVSLKGEDILLQSHTDVPVRYHRLRASLPGKLWRWRTVAGWKWSGNPEHINVLELRSTLTTIKWRVEKLAQFDLRCLHLVDSLVVLHALTRGRSSSRKMRRTLMRLCSYLLASGLVPLWGYIDTHQNPADKPSRRYVKKKWLKRK